MMDHVGHHICDLIHEENMHQGIIEITPQTASDVHFTAGDWAILDTHTTEQHYLLMHVCIVDPLACHPPQTYGNRLLIDKLARSLLSLKTRMPLGVWSFALSPPNIQQIALEKIWNYRSLISST